MKRFPTIELSYGQIDHTKVPFEIIQLYLVEKNFTLGLLMKKENVFVF